MVRLTKEYVGGIVAGFGLGLAVYPTLIRQFSANQLMMPALLLAVGGSFFVYATQRLAAAKAP